MELKAKQEYTTEKERLDFIVEYNHKQGYEIRYSEEIEVIPNDNEETNSHTKEQSDEADVILSDSEESQELAEETRDSSPAVQNDEDKTLIHNFIEAWGNDNEELLAQLKEVKLAEALEKAYEYENKTGFVTFDGRPVNMQDEQDIDPSLSSDEDISPRGERYSLPLSVELFNQGKFFQLVIGFAEGLLKHDFVYSTKEDVVVYINEQEAQGIYYAITQALSDLWTEKYPMYKAHIENAQTREELNGIVIDYSKDIEVEDVEEVTTESEGVDNEL